MSTHAMEGLIGLDWGTSSLRAFLLGADGTVRQERHRPWGIMKLPPAPDGAADAHPAAALTAAFERAFEDACGDWARAHPALPLLACGMVGSAQGWREAAYLDTPASLDGLARHLATVARAGAAPLRIVPGLIQRGALPDVMRGEETQVLGVLADAGLAPDEQVLIGLPGTHNKWVRARTGAIDGFDTFMTGEVFAALSGHTILGRTMQRPDTPDNDAFARGLAVTASDAGVKGLLASIFSTRTLGLTGALPAQAQPDYLSGLLIGHEVAALGALHPAGRPRPRVLLCGEPDLCRRYALALTHAGWAPPTLAEHATPRGLWQIARAAHAAGLLAPTTPE